MKRGSRLPRIALALVYLVALYILLSRFLPQAVMIAIEPSALVEAVALILLAESIRAARLALLYWGEIDPRHYIQALKARFAGNLAALLTPTVAGGEVVRGLILHGRVETKAAKAITAAAVDGGSDLLGNYLIALIAIAAHSAPAAPLPETLALPPVIAWLLVYTLLPLHAHVILEKLADKLESLNKRLFSGIASLLREAARFEARATTLLAALLLSTAAWLLQACSYMVLIHTSCARALGCTAETILMGVIPAPGGVGPGDVLLASKCRGIAA